MKSHIRKSYTKKAFDLLPLKDLTKTVFGEPCEDYDMLMTHPDADDPFWKTHIGGQDAKGATENINFPVLFTTSFYDLYTEGIFDMWDKMNEENKKKSALVVSPYDHSDNYDKENSIEFENGRRRDAFGPDYEIEWFDYIRGKKEKSPFETSKVAYYRLFENKWETDDFEPVTDKMEIKLGREEVSYVYNPYDAPRFRGGLSRAFGCSGFQDKPNLRHDIVSIYTEPFCEDTFIKGKITAKLKVKSDCEDTCFYIRISITKERGDFGLRDDITSLCYQLGGYIPNSCVGLSFDFDEHAFLIKKGEQLRIDIASADNENYVRHTNNKGPYYEQTEAKVAHNTVYLQDSVLVLPIENKL